MEHFEHGGNSRARYIQAVTEKCLDWNNVSNTGSVPNIIGDSLTIEYKSLIQW